MPSLCSGLPRDHGVCGRPRPAEFAALFDSEVCTDAQILQDYLSGLVDLALVNAFIVHKIAIKRKEKPVPTHVEFMRLLHVDILSQNKEDFLPGNSCEELLAAPLPRQPHALQQTKEKNEQKSRQWLCKVCSALAGPGIRSYESSYFCRTCSLSKKGRVSLCNKSRRLEQGSDLTYGTKRGATARPPLRRSSTRFTSFRSAASTTVTPTKISFRFNEGMPFFFYMNDCHFGANSVCTSDNYPNIFTGLFIFKAFCADYVHPPFISLPALPNHKLALNYVSPSRLATENIVLKFQHMLIHTLFATDYPEQFSSYRG
eukprot:jgi/Phyca11/132185/e_gw1.140.20.1